MIRLILFDMDGVLLKDENQWLELHRRYGTLDEGLELTKRYLYTDYDTLVQEVVGRLWKGKPAKPFLDLINEARYNPGAHETAEELHQRGYTLGIVSSGPLALVRRVQDELGIEDGYGNDLVIEDGRIAGKARHDDGTPCWPIGADDKQPAVEALAAKHGCTLDETAFVGDSKADLHAFKTVGLPIAFNNAPKELIEAAEERGGHHVSGDDLKKILNHFA